MSNYISDMEKILNNLGMNGKLIADKLNKYEEYESTGLKPEQVKQLNDALINVQKKLSKALDDLLEYKDLESKSLLIKLPCKIGTPVYFSTQDCDTCEDACDQCEWSEERNRNYCRNSYIKSLPFEIGFIKYIGKNMFLSEEEVKKSLR